MILTITARHIGLPERYRGTLADRSYITIRYGTRNYGWEWNEHQPRYRFFLNGAFTDYQRPYWCA